MIINSRIDGEFNGTWDEIIYNLQNGQVWQQVGYRYNYRYIYVPRVKIEARGSVGIMNVDCSRETIKARMIN